MKKNVTAKDIASYCGVSQATVSYVINNRTDEKISAETKQKVLDAIEELHYYPNLSARNMRKKNCTSVGIVCAKDYSRQAFLDSLEGISSYFDKINYTITIFYEEEGDTPHYVSSYFSNLVDGLIYISNNAHQDFIKPAVVNSIPYVVICMDGVFSKNSPMPHAFDDVLMECALFCKERKLQRIRYFSVDNNGLFVNHKYPIFYDALAKIYPQADIQHITCHVKARDTENLAPILAEYMKDNYFDLAISQNYDIGLLLQREILKRDFVLPQKIKNIFLNHVNFYDMAYPTITGIKIPYSEMGAYAARMVVAVISGQEEGFPYRNFKCHLQHRESTAF